MEINTSASGDQEHQVQATAVPLSVVSEFLLSLQLLLPLKNASPLPMPRASSGSAREAALRPHVAGFGDLRVESPICPTDCCLANSSTCRAHISPWASAPVPSRWGPRGHWRPGHVCRDCGCSPASVALRGLSYSTFLLPKQPAGGVLYKTEVRILVPASAHQGTDTVGAAGAWGLNQAGGWGGGMKSVEPGLMSPCEFGCGAWMGRSWHSSDHTLEEW